MKTLPKNILAALSGLAIVFFPFLTVAADESSDDDSNETVSACVLSADMIHSIHSFRKLLT